jgi:hypothetical protein
MQTNIVSHRKREIWCYPGDVGRILDITLKVWSVKKEFDKLNLFYLKHFVAQKMLLKEWKEKTQAVKNNW